MNAQPSTAASGSETEGRKTSDISERVSTSYDIVGHPQQALKPVEEGTHYKVLAYTDWADSFIPTVVQWNHGEVDDFTDPEKSRQNQAKAIEMTHSGKTAEVK